MSRVDWLDREEGRLRLADGRVLAFRDQGPRYGRPLVYCHGWPGSRLQGPPDPTLPRRLGLRLITLDRPGLGQSSPRPGRRLVDFPVDLAELLDALGVGRCHLVGLSGGGPYALATAWALPERVVNLGLVASLAPLTWPEAWADLASLARLGLRLARRRPTALRAGLTAIRAMLLAWRGRGGALPSLGLFPFPDRVILNSPAGRAFFRRDFTQAFAQGPTGPAQDLALLAGPWGFEPAGIRVPTRLWHGLDDRLVPPAHGRLLARALPDCRATFLPGAGHLFLFQRAELLGELLEVDSPSPAKR